MDLNEGMQSAYSSFSSTGDVSTTPSGPQPVVATQSLMPSLFAFQSLTPGSALQPHSMSYMLPASSQLITDCTASTLAGTVASAVNNSLQSTVMPIMQSGITGMTRAPATVPGSLVQPSSSAYTYSNRVGAVLVATALVIVLI